jgi:hypothetical protein
MTLVGCDLHSRKQQAAVLASLIMLLVLVIRARVGVTDDGSQARRRPPLLPRGSRSR